MFLETQGNKSTGGLAFSKSRDSECEVAAGEAPREQILSSDLPHPHKWNLRSIHRRDFHKTGSKTRIYLFARRPCKSAVKTLNKNERCKYWESWVFLSVTQSESSPWQVLNLLN